MLKSVRHFSKAGSVRHFSKGEKCLTLFVLAGVLAAPGTAHAATPSYEQTIDQLTRVTQAYRALAEPLGGYDVVFHRDPMQPLIDARGAIITSAGLRGGLAVQGIIWSDKRPLVVIDDRLYKQGDMVGPYRMVQVRPDGVVVQRDRDCLFIPLDRGLETPEPHPVAYMTLLEDVPPPMAPHHLLILLDSPAITAE